MKQKIKIAEILKDCPKGMELDCLMYEDVYFDFVDELNIIHCYIQHETHKTSLTFNQHGTPNSDIKSKCIIFPKGKTTWEGFVPPCKFKDGDVLFVDCSDSDDEDKSYQYIFILNDPDFYGKWHSYCHLDGVGCFHSEETYLTDDEYHPRFATEEEKANLFDAIKANGYVWNAENKTLKKLAEPKFKKGDIIQDKDGYKVRITNVSIEDECYGYESLTVNGIGGISFNRQDKWELVKNKFDITTLVPFESRVLMRSSNAGEWVATFYSHYSNNKFYGCGMCCDQCIPYEENQHLLGTTNDCDEYYKIW